MVTPWLVEDDKPKFCIRLIDVRSNDCSHPLVSTIPNDEEEADMKIQKN